MKKEIMESMAVWGANIPKQYFDIGIKLLNRLFNKEITRNEFLKECTYLTMKCGFEEVSPKPLPTIPEELTDYYAMSKDKKRKVGNDFWRQPAVKSYLDSKWKIIQLNLANRLWLKENLQRLEIYGDTGYSAKVRERIIEFQNWEDENWEQIKTYWKL